MSHSNDVVRRAHDLLDELDARAELSQEQEKLLRSFLPELPKPVTLEQLYERVHDAWMHARGDEWLLEDMDLEDWFLDLREDLDHLIEEQATPDVGDLVVGGASWMDVDGRAKFVEKPKPAAPALPVGMRLAEHENYGRCVVSPKSLNDGRRMVFVLDGRATTGACAEFVPLDSLTIIDAEPAHPEFLETEADYENAPVGTIVAQDGFRPLMKLGKFWDSAPYLDRNAESLAGKSRRVLRWGNK